MKKKITLIISLIAVISITSISLLSCDLVNRFRPSGVYTSKEYTNEEDGKTYRFLMKFEEEDATKDYCKGKVKYAYQYKEPNSDVWKTEELPREPKTYHIVFKKDDVNMINTPNGGTMKVERFTDDQNAKVSSSSSVYKVPLENFETDAGKTHRIFTGYKITHIEYEFPTTIS